MAKKKNRVSYKISDKQDYPSMIDTPASVEFTMPPDEAYDHMLAAEVVLGGRAAAEVGVPAHEFDTSLVAEDIRVEQAKISLFVELTEAFDLETYRQTSATKVVDSAVLFQQSKLEEVKDSLAHQRDVKKRFTEASRAAIVAKTIADNLNRDKERAELAVQEAQKNLEKSSVETDRLTKELDIQKESVLQANKDLHAAKKI
jgi:hypothetical protein